MQLLSRGRTCAAAVTLSALPLLVAGCSGGTSTQGSSGSAANLVVWTDSTRQAEVTAYLEAHKSVKATVSVVDSNGLQSKLSLLSRSPDKLPDVVFTPNGDSVVMAQKFGFSADLSSKIDDTTKSGFGATLSACTQDGKTYCLPMDISTQMLFYDKPLFDKFGYTVPTTWDEYATLSAKVAKEHPGYVTGSCGDGFCPNIYYRGSDCPGYKVNGKSATVNVSSDSNCTRVTSMLDPLIADKSVATLSPFDPDMAKLGSANKVLMLPGFVWYGEALYDQTFKVAKGNVAVAPLPTWSDGVKGVGAAVGGQWVISAKSKNADAAYSMIKSLTTDPSLLTPQVTFPAYEPAAKEWISKKASTGYYASDPSAVMESARTDVTGDLFTPVGADPLGSFASAVAPKVKAGATLASQMQAWADAMKQTFSDNGYNVTIAN